MPTDCKDQTPYASGSTAFFHGLLHQFLLLEIS
jgi:hypothetical protein